MATRNHAPAKPAKSRRSAPRYATKADIDQLTKAIDRIHDDETRYMICMTLDLITQSIADQAKEETRDAADYSISEMVN